jgi:hypothetical protein
VNELPSNVPDDKTGSSDEAISIVASSEKTSPLLETERGSSASPPSFKSKIDDHPLVVVIAAAVAAGTLVASILSYFNIESNQRVLSQHKMELHRVKSADDATIATLVAKNEILIRDLSSVTRTVGGVEKPFDVRDIIIRETDIRSLSDRFRLFKPEGVYIDVPKTEPWSFTRTSELEMMSWIQGKELAGQAERFFGPTTPLKERNILVWKAAQAIEVSVQSIQSPTILFRLPSRLSLYSFVALQRVDRKMLARMFSSIEADDESVEATGNASHKESSATDDPWDNMSRVFAGDMAGTMLVGQSQSILGIAQAYKNAVFSIDNAEKKGPVLYLSTHLEFRDVRVKGSSGAHTVYWDREIIVFAFGDTAIMVATSIPTLDDRRSSAYAWVQQWLRGLRIPASLQ